MFLFVRLVIATAAGFTWKWTRKSGWWMKNLPWIRIVSILTAVGMLISVVLEIIIKVQRIRSASGGTT